MSTKEKKVFSINNFRGLDKENKLLKVANFRASDGQNFIIDSETLKTRPAITHKDTLPFDIEVADKFVASYKFREVEIFITKLHIYIYNGTTVINEKHSNVLTQAISSFNFEGQEPLFREEKDCLFIFNVGYIYVFSILRDLSDNIYKYVLYPLSSKPSNPFGVNDYYYSEFDDLPVPYQPTIFVGSNSLDDMNLLSKVTKYKLFSSNQQKEDGKTTYYLPTVYEQAKHGYYAFAITFYQGKFAEHGIYPIFLGKEGEDVEDVAIDYGAVLNDANPAEIEDIFFPDQDFKYSVDHANIATLASPTAISEIVGMTKEWLFKAKVKGEDKQVFTYLLDYINYDQSLGTPLIAGNNKTLKFSVPIKYTAEYKDDSTDYVVAKKTETKTVDVYVQLKLFAVDDVNFTNISTLASDLVTEFTLANPYPAYPTTGSVDADIDLSSNPIYSPNLTNEAFISLVESYLRVHKEEYTDGQTLKIKAHLYNGANEVQEQLIGVDSNAEWVFREISTMINDTIYTSTKVKEYTLANAYPDYLYLVGDATVVDLYASPQQVVNFDSAYFQGLCEAYILANEANFSDGEKVRIRAQFKDYYEDVVNEDITPTAVANWVFATFPEIATHSEQLSSKTEYPSKDSTYPDYPTTDSGYTVIDLPDNPKLLVGYDVNDFIADCEAYVSANTSLFSDGQLVKFRGRYYETSTIIGNEVINAEPYINWTFRELNDLESEVSYQSSKVTAYTLSDPYPAYPTVSETGRTVITLTRTEIADFDINDFIANCNSYFQNNIASYSDGQLLLFKQQLYESIDVSENPTAPSYSPNASHVGQNITADDGSVWTAQSNTTTSKKWVDVGDTNFDSPTKANEGFACTVLGAQATSTFSWLNHENMGTWDVLECQNVTTTTYSWVLVSADGTYEYRQSFVLTATVQKGIYDKIVTLGSIATFPTIPSIANPNNYQVIDLGISHTFTGTSADLTSSALHDAIESDISEAIASLTEDSGYAYAMTRAQLNHSSGSAYDRGWTFAVLFYYEKYSETPSEIRQSMVMLAEIERNTYGMSGGYPSYPSFSNPNNYQVIDYGLVHTTADAVPDFNSATLLSDLETAISNNIASLTNNSGTAIAKFNVLSSNSGLGYSVIAEFTYQKYTEIPYEYRQSMVMELDIDRIILKQAVTLNNPTTFPAYPTFSNPSALQVLDLGIVHTSTSQYIDYTSESLLNAIEAEIIENLDSLTGESGNAFAKIKIQNSYNDGSSITNTGVSLVVGFYYQKYVSTPYENRKSFVYLTTVDTSQQMAEEGVYEYTYDDKEKAFVLKVKDYFFDYNDEPSIEVKIIFQNNPDYKMISDCKFGATFGSENRLFLAGNPKYPNIDRFNVSNDLLGNNIRNQSYELTYFPSKNYRVLGGKGAINGYVVATDSHLYVTKENYPNDEKLFIRERILDENGVVGYHEYKTSVKKSPLNNKCIVRFYNDILILSEDGLYGIEISSNVLTDERLIKSRDGFIKKDLINAIKNYDHSKIFMVENDIYLYIFVGDDIYVADSRYITKNEDGEIGNFSYEIVKWKANTTYLGAKIEEQDLELIQHDGKALYKLEINKDYDDLVVRYNDFLSLYDIQNSTKNAFLLPTAQLYIKDNPQDYIFKLKQGFKVIGVQGVDYHINNGMVVIDNSFAFRNISDGENVYFKENAENDFVSIEVSGYNEDGLDFPYNTQLDLDLSKIYMNIAELPLKVSLIFEFDDTTYFRLTPFTPSEVPFVKQENNETTVDYLRRLNTYLVDNQDYIFTTEGLQDCYINQPKIIETRWVSSMTDLLNNLMEKTMFRANIYATRQSKGSSLMFGYKTMRKGDYQIKDTLDIANQNSLEALNFNHFGFNTFSEMGASLPLKENNFLYIQFEIVGTGQIELNSIEIIYKLNRLLKSIG